jgi:uncharacterized protein (TIGR02996 family)
MDRGEQLLAAVYANPGDLEARQVYADWLQERGDPRGELIILQSAARTPEREERERQLVETYAESWHGRLAKITTWVEYEYGFLARCGINSFPAWAIGQREWATVKHLGCSEGWQRDLAQLITHPVMKSLVSLRIDVRALEWIFASLATTNIESLQLDGSLDEATLENLIACHVFANVRALEVRGSAPLATLLGVERFERVALVHHGWVITCTHGPDAKLSVMTVRQGKHRSRQEAQLAKLLQSLPRDALTSFTLAPMHPTIEKALARQTRLRRPL